MNESPAASPVQAFRESILNHYRESGRRFPWRETRIPYEIMVSEFMLQQTQTERVIPKYLAWLERFPDIDSVADSSLAEVLSLWTGLGYNRRARFLRDACAALKKDHGSRIPDDTGLLVQLPGIGPYTAAAVSTFAFNRPNVFVETNIRSVFIHFFFQDKKGIRDSEILPLVEATVDKANPREWYYALMDYGAELKRQFGNPNRASASYTRQSAFKGSNREARGAVIRHLGKAGFAAPEEIARAENLDALRIQKALEGLVSEGLVCEREGRYGIT